MVINKFLEQIQFYTKKRKENLNINFSIFILVLIVAQHSFLIKFSGIFILALFNWRTILKIDIKNIPPFYILILLIEVLKFFILDPDYSIGHIAQFLIGLIYWLSSLFLCMLIYAQVNKSDSIIIIKSLKAFTLINFCVSIFQFVKICIIEGVINPFNTGHQHPYGVSTGDMITGLFGGVHLTNVFVSLILILFYLHKRSTIFVFLSLIPFLLCGSNFGSILLLLCLVIYFIVSKQKIYAFKISSLIFLILISFYVIITPYNAHHTFSKIESIINKKPTVDEEYQQDVDNSTLISYKTGTKSIKQLDKSQQETIERLEKRKEIILYDFNTVSGKITSYQQTINFLKSNPKYMFFGAGIGRFSSNIAFNFSGIVDNSAMNRLFPTFQSALFEKNHKSIYAYMKTTHVIFHSESNKPFSSYNQLFGEYGIVGFFLFLLGYILFFIKKVDKRSYSIPVLIALLFALNLNYFFEGLNLFLFFEVIMFLNIKEKIQNERL